MRSIFLAMGVMFGVNAVEILQLDVIAYEDFVKDDPKALQVLNSALYEKGIVGIKGVPGYKEKVLGYIEKAREFSALSEDVKEQYAPKYEISYAGYTRGKENYKYADGQWLPDDQKVSYYNFYPDDARNIWPKEVDLKAPVEGLVSIMSEMGEAVMTKVGLIGPGTGRTLEGAPRVIRMLYYCNRTDSSTPNPYWASAHFDHSMLTTLLPAFYFLDGKQVPEPLEAGLFVKTPEDGIYKKVVADDPDVMLFQVGEFAQLAMDDKIRATEHRVHKVPGVIERYTLVLFADAPMDMVVHSTSVVTQDDRYGGKAGDPCSYRQWNDATISKFLVTDDK
ncbi:MAG: hypothetical protein ABSA17_03710 [Rhabdochlamydiaceae bacterium]|jgi:isopenicillin N synthase-like dioxygenase